MRDLLGEWAFLWFDGERQPVAGADPNHSARLDRDVAPGAPDFAADVNQSCCGRDRRARARRLPEERVRTGRRWLPVSRERQAAKQQNDPGDRQHRRDNQAQTDADPGDVAREHQRADHQAGGAADAERAKTRHLEFEEEQRQAERDQQQPRGIHRQNLKGKKRQQEAQTARNAGKDGAGVPQFDGQSDHAERQQQVGDLGMGDGAEKSLTTRHLDLPQRDIPGADGGRSAVESRDRAAIEPAQQVADIWRDQIDQGRNGAEGFSIREGPALDDGLLGEHHVATARFDQRSHIGGCVGRRLFRGRLVHRLSATRHRMGGADVRARRHRRDIGGHRQHEPGRGRTRTRRADEHHHRRARRDHARDDRPGRVEQATGCAQDDDDEIGAGGIGEIDDAGEILGRDWMDDAVQFGDVSDRLASLIGRGRPRGREHRGRQEGKGERRPIRAPHPVILTSSSPAPRLRGPPR